MFAVHLPDEASGAVFSDQLRGEIGAGGVLVDAEPIAHINGVYFVAGAAFVNIAMDAHFPALHERGLLALVEAVGPCLVLAEGDAGCALWVQGIDGVEFARLGGALVVDEDFGLAARTDADNDAAVVPLVEGIVVFGAVGVHAFHIHDVVGVWAAGYPEAFVAHATEDASGEAGLSFVEGVIAESNGQKGVGLGCHEGLEQVDGQEFVHILQVGQAAKLEDGVAGHGADASVGFGHGAEGFVFIAFDGGVEDAEVAKPGLEFDGGGFVGGQVQLVSRDGLVVVNELLKGFYHNCLVCVFS